MSAGDCTECALDLSRAAGRAAGLGRSVPAALRASLAQAGPDRITRRPGPAVWSPLEYAAHLGEAVQWYADRIERILTEEHPQLDPFDFDQAAVLGDYARRRPADVVADLDRAGLRLARLSGRIGAAGRRRWGVGSDGTPRTVDQLLARAVHELVHHELDIRNGLS